MNQEKKSPLKEKPLRYPGQSLDERIQELSETGLEYLMPPGFLFLLMVFEWWRWYKKIPPQPVVITVVAFLLLGYSIIRVIPILRKLGCMRRGRDGERFMGQLLESLHAKEFKVLHDVPTGRGNIDHVLVGPKGLFSIETKTISKPAKGETKVHYDGKSLNINGAVPDRDPLVQARAEASWIRAALKERTGKTFPVQAVIVYLGWFIDKTRNGDEVWVLHEDGLPTFLDNEKDKLTYDEAALAYSTLAHYIREEAG